MHAGPAALGRGIEQHQRAAARRVAVIAAQFPDQGVLGRVIAPDPVFPHHVDRHFLAVHGRRRGAAAVGPVHAPSGPEQVAQFLGGQGRAGIAAFAGMTFGQGLHQWHAALFVRRGQIHARAVGGNRPCRTGRAQAERQYGQTRTQGHQNVADAHCCLTLGKRRLMVLLLFSRAGLIPCAIVAFRQRTNIFISQRIS